MQAHPRPLADQAEPIELASTCVERFLFGLSMAILVAMGSPALAAPEPVRVIAALERIEADSLPLCSTSIDDRRFGATIDALLAGDEAAATVRDAVSPVEALNDLIYRRLGVKASRDIHEPCNLLPSAVLARREGYCVGIAAIYLALAERLKLPIHAVAIPSHVYLRYDDGKTRLDIETLAMGAPAPEGLGEVTAPASPAARGAVAFPRELSSNQFLAQVHNNLGVIHSEKSDHARAAAEYQQALALDPILSAAWYNWGNDLFVAGDYREAIRKLNEAIRLYPVDTWALNNRGRAFLALGKESRARRDFEAALAVDPDFRPARRNLKALDQNRAPGAAVSPAP